MSHAVNKTLIEQSVFKKIYECNMIGSERNESLISKGK